MRLEVIIPTQVCLDVTVTRITAEGRDGHFGIMPNHGDFVTELVPGILVYHPLSGPERFVAVHAGTLVKCGRHVRVAVENALESDDLAWLQEQVESAFRKQDEDERAARAALARLEADLVRRFRDLESLGR